MKERALSGDQIDVLIDNYIMSLYTDLEDEVIADIARRVKKTGRYTETAELMAKSMREQGYLPSKIQAEVMKFLRADKEFQMFVAENTKAYKEEVRKVIKETVREAKKAGDELVAQAGEMSWNADLSMWAEHGVDLKKPNTMSQLRKAFAMQTVNELRNLTRTTGFKNVNTGAVNVLNAYQRELDLAVLKVATGTFSYDQAVQDCVHRLAQSGLRSIDYESGRTYQLDTAVRNAVRTGCSQLAGKITEENLKSSGQDLVITSQHMGSRPEHAPWQNKVFSYSGKSGKYPDFFKETGYGTVTGLKGANCTHDFYPFWEGASIIPEDVKEPDPVMIGGKEYTYYQATQKQRSMERDIRALKREINATEALGMDSTELRSKLKMKTAEYRKFSDSANLKPKSNRLRIYDSNDKENKSKAVTQKNIQNIKKNKKEVEQVFNDNSENGILLSKEQVIEKAKRFGEEILQGKESLNYDNGNIIFDYVSRKLGYNNNPRVVNSEEFAVLEKQSPLGVMYRGITADSEEKAREYSEAFKKRKMYAGKSYAYGSGTYFSPNKDIADQYSSYGIILKAVMSNDSKIIKYNEIVKEYSSTGADVAKMKKGSNTEVWEDILSTVSEYAAIKGYDAIDMDGAFNQRHIIVLNRGKVVIEE